MSFQLAPKTFWWAELIPQFFYKLNSSKKVTCPSGKLSTEFTSAIAKSTSPGLLDTTFFACCKKIVWFLLVSARSRPWDKGWGSSRPLDKRGWSPHTIFFSPSGLSFVCKFRRAPLPWIRHCWYLIFLIFFFSDWLSSKHCRDTPQGICYKTRWFVFKDEW